MAGEAVESSTVISYLADTYPVKRTSGQLSKMADDAALARHHATKRGCGAMRIMIHIARGRRRGGSWRARARVREQQRRKRLAVGRRQLGRDRWRWLDGRDARGLDSMYPLCTHTVGTSRCRAP